MNKQVLAARQKCKPATDFLFKLGATRMEVLECPSGIVVERWLLRPSQQPVVLMATPLCWNAFAPVSDGVMIQDILDALNVLSTKGVQP